MGFSEASARGFAKGGGESPFKAVFNEINASYERRRKEDAQRDAEERQLKQVFAKLAQENQNAVDLQKMKGEQDIEKEYVKGEIEGSLRPLSATPMAAVSQAMQPPPQAAMSLPTGGFDDVKGEVIPEQKMASGVAQQAGLSPRTIKSPSGQEYEQVNKLEEIPEGMEVVGYDQKGRPMIRKVAVADKKFAAEQEENKKQQEIKSQGFVDAADDFLNSISEIEKGKENFGWKSLIPGLPESKKLVWDANMNKLLAKNVLQIITDMKNSSKTGATGFGSLNQPELKVITDGSTELKRTMSYEQAKPILDRMKVAVNKIKARELGQSGGSSQYVRTGLLPDGRKVGVKQDGTTEIISGQ